MRHIFLVVLLITITSCATHRPKKEIITIKKPVIITKPIPKLLLQECLIPAPPEIKLYLSYNSSKREVVLIKYIESLLLELGKCNTQLEKIRNINDTDVNLWRVMVKLCIER